MVIVIALTGATFTRNAAWHDDISLWEDATSKGYHKKRVYENLGIAY